MQAAVLITCFIYLLVKATGYASQHIWCLSQARINWEGCARKGIWRKNGGDGKGGAQISLDGVAVHPDCGCVCLCYLHFPRENPEDGEQRYNIWVSPVGAHPCLRKQEVRRPSQNAAQPCARAHGYVNDHISGE